MGVTAGNTRLTYRTSYTRPINGGSRTIGGSGTATCRLRGWSSPHLGRTKNGRRGSTALDSSRASEGYTGPTSSGRARSLSRHRRSTKRGLGTSVYTRDGRLRHLYTHNSRRRSGRGASGPASSRPPSDSQGRPQPVRPSWTANGMSVRSGSKRTRVCGASFWRFSPSS